MPPTSGTGASTSLAVGPEGATVELEGARLTIPANALALTVTITITSTTDPAPNGYTIFSPIYRFDPAGLDFLVPATASLAFTGDPTQTALYWTRAGGNGFDELGGTVNAGRIEAPVTHFSRGFAGLITGQPADLSGPPPDLSVPLPDLLTPPADASGCVPVTCASLGVSCGSVGNGCGAVLTCGPPCTSCPTGETLCNSVCVSTATDPLHCGSCINVCPTGQVCVSGQCALAGG
jgi:hypothetical protein